MRFLVYAANEALIVEALRAAGYDEVSFLARKEGQDLSDQILELAKKSNDRILVTDDAQFARETFRKQHILPGLVLVRFERQDVVMIQILTGILRNLDHRLEGRFTEVQVQQKTLLALTKVRLDKLLRSLDPDQERAGERYAKLHRRLVRLFRSRGCLPPEDYADKTLDEVARKIDDGEEIQNIESFSMGVACTISKKCSDNPPEPIDELLPSRQPAVDPHEEKKQIEEREQRDREDQCMQQCLQTLPSAEQELIQKYEAADKDERKRMAERLSISLNALTMRAFKIRKKLRECCEECLKRTGETEHRR